jgi:hypothetical protein
MKRIIKGIILQSFISSIIVILIYIISKSLLIAGFVLFILLLLVLLKPVILVLNRLTLRTNWYNKKIGGVSKFRKRISLDLDICNLGSNSGKYAFDYENTNLKGGNWALSPQTLSYDFRVLKNYFSYLKEGATVLIPLCPFSGCIKDFEDDNYNYKYYFFLHPILILNYSQQTRDKILKFVNRPFQVSPLKSILRIVKDIPMVENSVMNREGIERNALKFINSWKEQFMIDDLEAAVSKLNSECLIYNENVLNEMISFCVERKLKPVIILPPVTMALSSKLSEVFRESYIYSFIRNANTSQVKFLDYFDDERFADLRLYSNSYFLNKSGQELFTSQVLNDLKLL